MVTLSSEQQAFLKWAAVGSMVVDHVGMVLLPDWLFLRLVGRVAFPLFGFLLAYNMAARGVPARKYLRPLALFAVISQAPFVLAAGAPWWHLNIFITLLLGVVASGVMRRELPAWWLLLLPLGLVSDYGLAGVLMIVCLSVGLEDQAPRSWVALVGAAVLLVIAQAAPVLGLVALLGVALVLWVSNIKPKVGRGPRWLFYWFYPAHLAVLVVVRALLEVGRSA